MLNKKIFTVLIAVLAVIGIISANYIFKNDEVVRSPQNSNDSNVIVEENPSNNPDLDKPMVSKIPQYTGRPLSEVRFGAGFSASQAVIETKRGDLKVLAAILTANPNGGAGVGDWIGIGIIKKFFNDYEGARDAWEYAGVLYPNNALSFANLGNLYGFYFKDNIKAEANFLRAISNDPYQAGYYISLADFYQHIMPGKKSEAAKILLSGLEIIKDPDLFFNLAVYYRDIGDKPNALKYYQDVLNIDPKRPGIAEEIAKLK